MTKEQFFDLLTEEIKSYNQLLATEKSVLSTWHHNAYRENEIITRYWGRFHIQTKDHFYHSGGKVENRKSMVEALIYNFQPVERNLEERQDRRELTLF